MNIKHEQETAYKKYGHFNSTHEIYGVLKEEVEEFWDVVKENPNSYNMSTRKDRMLHELTQVAAIAQRAIEELKKDEVRWV